MDNSTVYAGHIDIQGEMSVAVADYINCFSAVRHMKRDNKKLKELHPDWVAHVWDYRLGTQGEFYVPIDNPDEMETDYHDESIIDINMPPDTQPSLWCQWVIEGDRTFTGIENAKIVWDQGEKFYFGPEWMRYLINKFLNPKGYICNGMISGIDESDSGEYILVIQNQVYSFNLDFIEREKEGDFKTRAFIALSENTPEIPEELVLKKMVRLINEKILSYEELLKKREEWYDS